MLCPKCGRDNPGGNVFCRFCHEPLAARETFVRGAQERPSSTSVRPVASAQAGKQNRAETADHSGNVEQKSKPQKSRQQKTKVKSKRPKKTKTVYKSRPKRQKKDRRGRREVQVVKKRGGFLAGFLTFLLLAIVAAAIAGALIVHHYGLQNILNHFGYQVTSIQPEDSSSEQPPSSLPESSSVQSSQSSQSESSSSERENNPEQEESSGSE